MIACFVVMDAMVQCRYKQTMDLMRQMRHVFELSPEETTIRSLSNLLNAPAKQDISDMCKDLVLIQSSQDAQMRKRLIEKLTLKISRNEYMQAVVQNIAFQPVAESITQDGMIPLTSRQVAKIMFTQPLFWPANLYQCLTSETKTLLRRTDSQQNDDGSKDSHSVTNEDDRISPKHENYLPTDVHTAGKLLEILVTENVEQSSTIRFSYIEDWWKVYETCQTHHVDFSVYAETIEIMLFHGLETLHRLLYYKPLDSPYTARIPEWTRRLTVSGGTPSKEIVTRRSRSCIPIRVAVQEYKEDRSRNHQQLSLLLASALINGGHRVAGILQLLSLYETLRQPSRRHSFVRRDSVDRFNFTSRRSSAGHQIIRTGSYHPLAGGPNVSKAPSQIDVLVRGYRGKRIFLQPGKDLCTVDLDTLCWSLLKDSVHRCVNKVISVSNSGQRQEIAKFEDMLKNWGERTLRYLARKLPSSLSVEEQSMYVSLLMYSRKSFDAEKIVRAAVNGEKMMNDTMNFWAAWFAWRRCDPNACFRYLASLSHFCSTSSLDENNVDIAIQIQDLKASAHLIRKEKEVALNIFQDILRSQPLNMKAAYQIAHLTQQLRSEEEAEEAYQRVINTDLSSVKVASPKTAHVCDDACLCCFPLHYSRHNFCVYVQIIKCFHPLKFCPTSAEENRMFQDWARLGLAHITLKQRRVQTALHHCSDIQFPSLDAILLHGWCHYAAGDYAAARAKAEDLIHNTNKYVCCLW